MPQEDSMVNTTKNNPKVGPIFPDNVYKAQVLMDQVLTMLRDARDEVSRPAKFGGRELSEAITCFETGCMNMNRALFAEKPYSPILPRPEVKKED